MEGVLAAPRGPAELHLKPESTRGQAAPPSSEEIIPTPETNALLS